MVVIGIEYGIDGFELWCWRRLLRVPWTLRWSKQLILKEFSPECSLEGMILKLKLQYLAIWYKEPTRWKRPWCWERLKTGGEGVTDDVMVRWYHPLNGHEFDQAPGVGEGQGGLACCSPWGRKRSETTEWLNNNKWLRCLGQDTSSLPFCASHLWNGHDSIDYFVESWEWNELIHACEVLKK